MHPYDVPRRQSYQPIPSSRSAEESPHVPSATPIYDRLYSEWVKTFRSLPGDRSGEEQLGFTAFGNSPHTTGSYGGSSYSAYSAGAFSARQQSQWQRVGPLGRQDGRHGQTATAVWQSDERQHGTGMHHIPAALPPGPRRGA
ncbi:hypothetical protein [Streptomyces sp. NPDC005423]|uniref:hypothetical protein n=1 Tax=Streptomyces sp. NPDC005423 TaxID=3155343 RepID=UPI0033B8A450